MPIYRSDDGILHGMPLGALGAGKLELTPQGLFTAFTFQNNWSRPQSGDAKYPGILGYHLGFYWEKNGKKKAVLLQTAPVGQIPLAKGIEYDGSFPEAELIYQIGEAGVDLRLRAFSPFATGDAKLSRMPAAYFELSVKNQTGASLNCGLLFIGRNTSGDWCVGRRNRVTADSKTVECEFLNDAAGPKDQQNGVLRWSFSKKDWQLSYEESWNSVTKNFFYHAGTIDLKAWESFSKTGKLKNSKTGEAAPGENREFCSAVAAYSKIASGEEKKWEFQAAWHFPIHDFGHRYEKDFKNATSVSVAARAARSRADAIQKKFTDGVRALPVPEWFQDSLLTNLAPMVASSWYTRDGRFAFYEAPQVCPLMGTLDVGFYGSIPLSYFFGDLSMAQMAQFAKVQRKDGYVPHDLGRNRLDCPSNGTTYYYWKDLSPKFVLMVYRDFFWSGNKAFVRAMYPHVRRAVLWTLSKDADKNGLPDHEGADQTFDLWEMKGAHPYTASLFLAALLAAEKMAYLNKDNAFARSCRAIFSKARKNYEKLFWNGRFFGETCSLGQLNGQWYARLLDLEPIADPAKIKTALESILELNGKPSAIGLINSALANGQADDSNDHSKNIWPGMNYAFISLALMEGFPLKNLLKPAKGIWDNVTASQKSPWNQADTMNAETGAYVFGDYYYRNMAIWSIPLAMAKMDASTAQILQSIKTSKV